MSNVCLGWTAVNDLNSERKAIVLFCQSWHCETCQPKRRKQLIARLFSGKPTRWMTLTVNPNIGDGPEDRCDRLKRGFNHLVKRIRRRWPKARFEFAAIVEKTKLGEPHLHIPFRGPWIPQRWLSEQMADLIDAPIVDIRWLHGKKQTMSYVCKYVGKAPHQFGTKKRYWFSQNYEPAYEAPSPAEPGYINVWRVIRRPLSEVVKVWQQEGYILELCRDGVKAKKRC